MPTFTRRTFTTRGADPTEVVVWTDGTVTLTEFQDIVLLETDRATVRRPPHPADDPSTDVIQHLADALHAALERAHHAEEELARMDAEDDDPFPSRYA